MPVVPAPVAPSPADYSFHRISEVLLSQPKQQRCGHCREDKKCRLRVHVLGYRTWGAWFFHGAAEAEVSAEVCSSRCARLFRRAHMP
jgi:hypothetical protein